MKKTKKSYLVVGLGRFGISLCEKLIELEQSVIGVDIAPGPVAEMSEKIDIAAQIDATDESALIKAGAKEVDVAVVTVSHSLESSVLATSILRDLGVPLVIGRASNAMHAKLLSRVGAHKIVFPEWDMGHRLAENLVFPWYSRFIKIGGSDLLVGKISPQPEMVGKSIAELRFSQTYNVIVMLVERNGDRKVPQSNVPIEADDTLWVAGTQEALGMLVQYTGNPDEFNLAGER